MTVLKTFLRVLIDIPAVSRNLKQTYIAAEGHLAYMKTRAGNHDYIYSVADMMASVSRNRLPGHAE